VSDFVFLHRTAGDANAFLRGRLVDLIGALNYRAEDVRIHVSNDGSMAVAHFRRRTGLYGISEQSHVADGRTVTVLKGHIVAKQDGGAEVMSAARLASRLRGESVDAVLEHSSGDFAVCEMQVDQPVAQFFNDMLSMVSLFYADSVSGQLVVATRPRLIQRVLPEWDFDYEGLAWQAVMYWPLGDGTLVRQIRRCPQGGRLVVSNGRLSVIERPMAYLASNQPKSELTYVREHADVALDRVIGDMNRSIEAIVEKASSVDFALTGGKGSRAIAGLVTAGNESLEKFNCFTSGVEVHPDVIVASRVAAVMGCQHSVNLPGKASYSAKTILHGRLGAIFRYDGMLPSWDGAASPYAKDGILLQGHVGEVYRDKWFQATYSSSTDFARRMFVHSVDPNRLLRPEAKARFFKQLKKRADWYLENGASLDLIGGVFRIEGMQSWERAGFSQGALWAQHAVHPLYDPALIRLSFLAEREWRDDERIHFEIIRRSRFNLVEIPFAGQQWHAGLKRSAGALNIDAQAVEHAASLVSPSGWQAGLFFPSPLQRFFLSIFESLDDSPLWDLFDRDAVFDAITRADPGMSSLRMTRMYSLLTSFMYAHGFELPIKFDVLPGATEGCEHRSRLRSTAGVVRVFEGRGTKCRLDGDDAGIPTISTPDLLFDLLEGQDRDAGLTADLYGMFGKLRAAVLENRALQKASEAAQQNQ
jgi:hypothetical protein